MAKCVKDDWALFCLSCHCWVYFLIHLLFYVFAVVLFRTDRFVSVVIKLAKKVQNLM